MSKMRRYIVWFALIFGLVCLLYIGTISLKLLPIDLKSAGLILGFLSFIFFTGMFIIAPGLNQKAEHFVFRFLILTTVQMLTFLFSIVILIIQKVESIRMIGFHAVTLFCVFLFVQSFLLIKLTNAPKQ